MTIGTMLGNADTNLNPDRYHELLHMMEPHFALKLKNKRKIVKMDDP